MVALKWDDLNPSYTLLMTPIYDDRDVWNDLFLLSYVLIDSPYLIIENRILQEILYDTS